MAFLESLRLSNIFPRKGQKPFGMPDLDVGSDISANKVIGIALDEREKDRQLQREMMAARQPNQRAMVPDFETKILSKLRDKRKSDIGDRKIIFSDMLTAKDRANLAMKQRELDIRESQGQATTGIRQQQAETAQQRADTYGRVSALKDLPDSERLRLLQEGKVSLAEINAANALERTNVQQTGATSRTRMQQEGASQRQEVSGAQRLNQIGAQLAGQKEIAGARISAAKNKPLLPTQQRTNLSNQAQQLMNQRPDLAEFISIDEKGNVSITAEEGTPERDMINNLLYSQGDIQLTGESPLYTNKKPVSQKATQTKKSKYNVTIE